MLWALRQYAGELESFHEDRSSGIEPAEYYLRPDYYGEIILDDD